MQNIFYNGRHTRTRYMMDGSWDYKEQWRNLISISNLNFYRDKNFNSLYFELNLKPELNSPMFILLKLDLDFKDLYRMCESNNNLSSIIYHNFYE